MIDIARWRAEFARMQQREGELRHDGRWVRAIQAALSQPIAKLELSKLVTAWTGEPYSAVIHGAGIAARTREPEIDAEIGGMLTEFTDLSASAHY